MRTTRQTVKPPSKPGRGTVKNRSHRVGKTGSNQKENNAPSLDDIQEIRMQVTRAQCKVPSTVVRVKEKRETSNPLDELTTNARTEQIPKEDVEEEPHTEEFLLHYGSAYSSAVLDDCVHELECVKEESPAPLPTEPSTMNQIPEQKAGRPQVEDLLQHFEHTDSLAMLDSCMDEFVYEEVVSFECNSETATKSSTVANLMTEVLQHPEDDSMETSSTYSRSPTNAAIFKKQKLYHNEVQAESSSFHGNLKLCRFMMCEWFYSHIDYALFADECSRSVDFGTLLRQHYPTLHKCTLNRAQWNHIRKEFGKITPVRRFSPAFLLQERITLERRREKVRFLMENPMIEYLDDDIPSIIPSRIDVGSKVRAALLSPRYGSFPGVVIGIEHQDLPMFRIRFEIDGNVHEQILPDYQVALDQSLPEAKQSDVLSVSVKHLKQVAILKESVHEKKRLLQELENIRLNTEARHSMGLVNTDRDHEQSQRYEQTIRKLLDLNCTILQLLKHVADDYDHYMAKPLTTNSTIPVVERYVTEVANQLTEDCGKLDHIHNNPLVDQLWAEAMKRLRKKPEYMEQFEHYLASRIGTKFDLQAYRML